MFIKAHYALSKISFSLRESFKFPLSDICYKIPFQIYIHEGCYALIAIEDINFIIVAYDI